MSDPDSPNPVHTLKLRVLLALAVALVVVGGAFWSGYSALRGPDGWIGSRRYNLQYVLNLDTYHKEHGVYPETLPKALSWYPQRIVYERTDDGWKITDYGQNEKPGGNGVDADFVYVSGMNEYDVRHAALKDKKFNATFHQVRTKDAGKWFNGLLGTTLVFGVMVFGVTLSILNGLKKKSLAWSIVSVCVITISAVVVCGFITVVHSVSSGH